VRQLFVEQGMELLFVEERQTSLAGEHRIGERSHENRHVVVGRRAQDDAIGRELVREHGHNRSPGCELGTHRARWASYGWVCRVLTGVSRA
jgi:hypothetical protein